MVRKNPNRPDRGPDVGRHVIGVTTAGMLALLAVLAAAHKGGKETDVDSEAMLQHALRPTMVRTAGEITRFAAKHPSLSKVEVGKKTVDVVIEKTMESGEGGAPPKTTLETVTRRQDGSTEPDPDKVLSVAINLSGHVRGDPEQNYEEIIAMRAPGTGNLGWGAWEHVDVADVEYDGPPQLHIDSTRAEDPVAAARVVAADTQGILKQAEVGLDPSLRFR